MDQLLNLHGMSYSCYTIDLLYLHNIAGIVLDLWALRLNGSKVTEKVGKMFKKIRRKMPALRFESFLIFDCDLNHFASDFCPNRSFLCHFYFDDSYAIFNTGFNSFYFL